jgi:hypothetical protein
MYRHTKLGVGVGGVRIDGVLHRLVVGLYGDLALASTALVLIVLNLASGNILGAHVCVVVVVCVGRGLVFEYMLDAVGILGVVM